MADIAETDAASVTPKAVPLERAGQLRFSLMMMFLLCLVCIPFFIERIDGNAPKPVNGTLNLSNWQVNDQPMRLEGSWSFAWLHPALPGVGKADFPARVPGVWTGLKAPDGGRLPDGGVGRYRLVVSGIAPGPWRLYVPTIFAANRIYVDGELVGERGKIGLTAADTRYHWRASDIVFRATGKPVTIEVEIGAALHRDNGIESAPLLGRPQAIADWLALRWAQEMLTQVSLILLGLSSLTAFMFRRQDRASLAFAVCSFALIPNAAIIGIDNLALIVFPTLQLLPMMFILYNATVFSLFCLVVYANALFPQEQLIRPFRILQLIILSFLIAQALPLLWGDTMTSSRISGYFAIILLIALLYVATVLVRAVKRKRAGALVFLLGMSVLFVSAILLSITSAGLIPRSNLLQLDLISFGVLVALISHMIILSERWTMATLAAEGSSRDLRQIIEVNASITSEIELDAVLRRIVEGTSQVLRADRSSLFVYDERKHQLWTLVAEGLDQKTIRVPADKGIVGRCFASGEVTIVDDPYADPDFLRAQDEASGYRTRSMIALPLITRDGRKIGVLQALNHISGGSFDRSDAESMRAFSAQAAVALDNARLFSEVTASRNYSASVLRSMSNGVVTIDRSGEVTGLNDAACSILGIAQADVEAYDWQSWIALHNRIVLDEIRNVSGSGSSKTLLDIDLQTVPGDVISANVSIVPLMGETGEEGLLLIVEDISAGKRLEGAMRRFMTQEVMDQVLSQQGDLMFGTACSASVLFADIRNFTTLAETLSPRETVDMLNEIFTDLFDAVADHGGVLDKYIGDAVMAVFGAPLTRGDDAQNAVRSALKMQEMMASINARRMARGEPVLKLGVGIASGDVVAGTIGSPKRMDYTVIGDSVNLAARLQDLTKSYGCDIILCERTAALAGDFAHVSELDQIQVKGRVQLERIFEAVAIDRVGKVDSVKTTA